MLLKEPEKKSDRIQRLKLNDDRKHEQGVKLVYLESREQSFILTRRKVAGDEAV